MTAALLFFAFCLVSFVLTDFRQRPKGVCMVVTEEEGLLLKINGRKTKFKTPCLVPVRLNYRYRVSLYRGTELRAEGEYVFTHPRTFVQPKMVAPVLSLTRDLRIRIIS